MRGKEEEQLSIFDDCYMKLGLANVKNGSGSGDNGFFPFDRGFYP